MTFGLSCGRFYSATRSGILRDRSPVPKRSLIMSQKTEQLNSTISLSDSLFVVGSTTYPLRQITSVRGDTSPPKNTFFAIVFLLSILWVAITIIPLYQSFRDGSSGIAFQDFPIVSVCVAVISFIFMRRAKTSYHLIISTAAGETEALTSKNKGDIVTIITKLNKAIAGLS